MEISEFSEDKTYRYLSTERISNSSDRELLLVMFNPATTAETINDPKRQSHRSTRNRCKKAAEKWGFGILTVVNLFALRAPKPENLRGVNYQCKVGPENDRWICAAVARADKVVVAWGNDRYCDGRSTEVLRKILKIQTPYHMGRNGKKQIRRTQPSSRLVQRGYA